MNTNLKKYYQISLEELKNCLQSDKGWNIILSQGTQEYIFEFSFKSMKGIVIRVASSITKSDCARACGQDAIRVYSFNTISKKGFVKGKSVYRIASWEKNLKKAVMNCYNDSLERGKKENRIK